VTAKSRVKDMEMRESKLTSEHPTGIERERGRELGKNLSQVEPVCLADFIEVWCVSKEVGRE
jgi:hypothetical protein